MRVAGGTWILGRSDIESMSDWDDPVEVDFDGRPVEIVAKGRARRRALQRVVVKPVDRPMTLSDKGSQLLGKKTSTAWLVRGAGAWTSRCSPMAPGRARARAAGKTRAGGG